MNASTMSPSRPTAPPKSRPGRSLRDRFASQLQDAVGAELQWLADLPKLAKAARDRDLKAGLEAHLAEARSRLRRWRSALDRIDAERGADDLQPAGGSRRTRVANAPEHDAVGLHGMFRAYARELGLEDAAGRLLETLEEEEAIDATLREWARASFEPHGAGCRA